MKRFDRKFGSTFLENCPQSPGVYSFFDESGVLIYVGRAKNLRRRLGQYRNVQKGKKCRKQNRIIKEAHSLRYDVCATHLDACLLEADRIQAHRPRLNVAGAYYFLYPMIGIKRENADISFCYTTLPETMPGYSFHGAYRSRSITSEGFFSLMELLSYLVRSVSKKKVLGRHEQRATYSHVYHFRMAPLEWENQWGGFLEGKNAQALEDLMLTLIDKAAARQRGRVVQDKLDLLNNFWTHEVQPLAAARAKIGEAQYPVLQRRRDQLFLQAKFGPNGIAEI